MPSALILIADGTEEIEFVTPYDVLVRAGFEVKSVGVGLKDESYAKCSRGVCIKPDINSVNNLPSNIQSHLPDILILPGGLAGAAAFNASEATLQLINRFQKEEKWIAFICAATTVLVKATDGLENAGEKSWRCKVTSHPSVKEQIVEEGWDYSEERVVTDGKVITSRGPGTALLFALTLVECLLGKAKRDEVASPMVIADAL